MIIREALCMLGWHSWSHQYDNGLDRARRQKRPGQFTFCYVPDWKKVCSCCGITKDIDDRAPSLIEVDQA